MFLTVGLKMWKFLCTPSFSSVGNNALLFSFPMTVQEAFLMGLHCQIYVRSHFLSLLTHWALIQTWDTPTWSLSLCDIIIVECFQKNVFYFLLSVTRLQERNVRRPLARAQVLKYIIQSMVDSSFSGTHLKTYCSFFLLFSKQKW